MKFSVSTHSYSQLTNSGKMEYLDIFKHVKKVGFDAAEVSAFKTPEGMTDIEYAKKIRAAADDAGIAIVNYCVAADFVNGSDGDFDKEVENVRHFVDIGEILGVKSMRHDAAWNAGKYKSFDGALERIANGCREVSKYAQTKGIRTMVENHGSFAQESFRMEKLFNAVNYDNFSLLVDMGNFTCAEETPHHAVGRVAPYAGFVHAKDFIIKKPSEPNPGRGFFQGRGGTYLKGTIIGHGDVDVQSCITALKCAGYDGFISIEFEGMENALEAIEIGLENLKRYTENA